MANVEGDKTRVGSSREGAGQEQKRKPNYGSIVGLSGFTLKEDGGMIATYRGSDGEPKDFNLFNQVGKFDNDKLEIVMSLAKLSPDCDMKAFIRGIEYQGFNRLYYIQMCLSKMSVSLFIRFAILGAVRGSNFQKVIDTAEEVPQDMITSFQTLGFVKTPKKKDHITILRCTASVPHWCAYYMFVAGCSGKVAGDCPPCLQFPGAASLPMSETVRRNHIKFCFAFSAILPGGVFNVNIYKTMMENSIPTKDIPNEILSQLGVVAGSNGYKLTETDMEPYTKQLVVKK